MRRDETDLHRRLSRSGLPFGTCLNAVYLHPQGSDQFKPILGGGCTRSIPTTPPSDTSPTATAAILQSMPGMRELVFQAWTRFGWYLLVSRRDPPACGSIRLRRLGRREKLERPAQ